MKYLFPLLALFILLRPFSPYAEYVLNYKYISEVLCINKEKPKLECKGKCYLMQSLAEASNDSGDPNEIPLKKLDFQLLYLVDNSISKISFAIENTSNLEFNTASNTLYHSLSIGKLFRPPIS